MQDLHPVRILSKKNSNRGNYKVSKRGDDSREIVQFQNCDSDKRLILVHSLKVKKWENNSESLVYWK